MRVLIYIAFFGVFMCYPLQNLAQQTPQYSQWAFNHFAINPALAGIKNCLDVRSGYRLQWAGFEGAPNSGLFTINAPLNKKRKQFKSSFHGLGAKVEHDVFGNFNNFALTMAYALHFPLEKGKRLSFGASAGFQQFGFDHTQATTIDPDVAVAQSANMFLVPLIGAGGWFHTENWFVGASIDQLARNRWDDIGFSSRFQLHTRLTAGAKVSLKNNISLLPAMLFRIPPAGPPSVDLNLMVDFGNFFLTGLGYRNVDAVIAFFKFKIKKFTVGYSFDFTTSNLQGGHYNTHEISLSFNTCRSRKTAPNACPLFE